MLALQKYEIVLSVALAFPQRTVVATLNFGPLTLSGGIYGEVPKGASCAREWLVSGGRP